MDDVSIKLPDGSSIKQPAGVPVKTILASWQKESLTDAVAAMVNGRPVDLTSRIEQDAEIDLISVGSEQGLEILRHSISHVMAQAVQETFKDVKVSIGPAIEDGFYYDFDYDQTFTPEDLEKIEKRMREIVAADLPFARQVISREEAVNVFQKRGETYKLELLNDLPSDVRTVSLYTQGEYVDLCRGPHIPSTGRIKAFKLMSVAGAYWRGDERNKMLQRIYGTGFADQKELDHYLSLIEEAKKRDHRRLGRELDLFQINEEVGPGLAIFHPKGAMLRLIIEDWERKEHLKRGYDIVVGPQILRGDLWKKSGHFDHNRDMM
jgi:threonyl-tRNA synthetase